MTKSKISLRLITRGPSPVSLLDGNSASVSFAQSSDGLTNIVGSRVPLGRSFKTSIELFENQGGKTHGHGVFALPSQQVANDTALKHTIQR